MKPLILLLVCLVLGGCISRMERPTSWPKDKSVQDVQEIAGTYLDADAMLRRYVFRTDVSREPAVRIFSAAPATISLELELDSGARKVMQFPFTIEEGWLVFSRGRGLGTEGVMAIENIRFAIRPDVTGALILKVSERSVGTMFLIPAVGGNDWWSRLPKQPNKAPEPTTTSVTSPAAQEPRQP